VLRLSYTHSSTTRVTPVCLWCACNATSLIGHGGSTNHPPTFSFGVQLALDET
jgi:hypothetical protein